MADLGEFEGRVVAAATVKIVRAGDGLSEAMTLEPEAIGHGETVYLVLRGEVTRVGYETVPKADQYLRRVHTISAREVARVSEAAVQKLLDDEAERLARLKERQAGIERLPMGDDPLDVFDRSEP